MNSMGLIRGYLSKTYNNENFMILVGESIEKQLQEWDGTYAVNIMKFQNYIFIVKNGETEYRVDISEELLADLQSRGPYALDKQIWLSLERQGMKILTGYGDYLKKVLGRM